MGKIIGIDLGTTNSAVAVYENDQPKIFENAQGKRTTPSVVALKITRDRKTKEVTGTEWLVGEAAKRQSVANAQNTFFGVKRLIGRRFDDPAIQTMQALSPYKIVAGPNGDAWVEVDGKPMAPAEISAKVLRTLKEAVEAQLGEPVTEAVITVPAYFNDAQRQATVAAGKIAGLDVKRIVNEPTAAALAYGMDKKQDGKIAVFDLGGGTFDVSILDVTVDEEDGGALIRVLSTNGDTFLGGENFDERITDFLIDKLNEEHGTDINAHDAESKAKYTQEIQRLRDAAEELKKALSSQTSAAVNLPFLTRTDDDQPVNFELEVTRAQLEKLVQDLVDKTLEPCKQALADAGLKVSDLDEVILVGGQTRMPKVVETVKNFFGKEPRRDVNPDEIVAMGASAQGAIITGSIDNVVLADVIPLSIGIRTAGDTMMRMIERNSTIPTTASYVFSTAKDNQRDVSVMIYQGEREQASANKLLGQFTLDGIPPAKAGVPQIEVSLNIDADGVLLVAAKDLKTGRAHKITVKANGGLSDSEIEKMLQDAEANAEKDRLFRETREADVNAAEELNEAAVDTEQEYFKSASDELKAQFAEAVEELTAAREKKDLARLVEKTEKLRNIRSAIGEAFGNASSNDNSAGAAAEEAAEDVKTSAAPQPPPQP